MKKLKTQEFIIKAKNIHGNKYDYSLVNYDKCHSKVIIKCKSGHTFDQTPHDHLEGNGCRFCSEKYKKNTEEFIKMAEETHGKNRYDYSLVKYKTNRIKVEIICNNCGNIFSTRPSNHIQLKRGCPHCNRSKGENSIVKWLEEK